MCPRWGWASTDAFGWKGLRRTGGRLKRVSEAPEWHGESGRLSGRRTFQIILTRPAGGEQRPDINGAHNEDAIS